MTTYISDRVLTTRKRHLCNVCDQMVEKGESCHSYTGADDGIFTVHYHHMCWSYTRGWDYWDWQQFCGGADRREVAALIIAGTY